MNVVDVKQFFQPVMKRKRLLFERISDVGDVYCIEDVFQLIYSFQNTNLICRPMWNFFTRIEKRIQFSRFILDIEFYSRMRMCGQLRIPVRHCIVGFKKFMWQLTCTNGSMIVRLLIDSDLSHKICCFGNNILSTVLASIHQHRDAGNKMTKVAML